MDNLKFNEDEHTYFLNNCFIPCVSEILRPLSSVEYDGIQDSILENAQERGTAVHLAIELFNKYKFSNIDERFKEYFEAYKKWIDDYEIDVSNIASEIQVYDEVLWYAGTTDMIVNENTLVDIKTTANLNLDYVSVQTSAYKRAYEKNTGKKIDKTYVLWLRKNGDYEYIELKENFNIFIACLQIHNFLKK